MRQVEYERHWFWPNGHEPFRGNLVDLILDIDYFIELHGVIPPFEILKEKLAEGRRSGMGTHWTPIPLSLLEYEEIVTALRELDVLKARALHPYIRFERIVFDEFLSTHHFREITKENLETWGCDKDLKETILSNLFLREIRTLSWNLLCSQKYGSR